MAANDRLPIVIDAFRASDPSKEQSLSCKGRCHLAKFSHRLLASDIDNLGARTLADVLKHFPGIYLTKDRFGRFVLGSYGVLGNERIQVLIDGVRYNDPYDGAAFLTLPADVIDFIDVYYGPSGTWFGEGALLGVIAVTTKSMPAISTFSYLSSDLSLGGGMMTRFRRNGMKLGAFSAFSVLDQNAVHITRTPSKDSFTSKAHDFGNAPLFNFWASAFLDAAFSSAQQTHFVARTTFSAVEFQTSPTLFHKKSTSSQKKLIWINDFHFVKKKAQKDALDIFMTTGIFMGHHFLDANHISKQALLDREMSCAFEVGSKFHTTPFRGHDLFFGVGAVLDGLYQPSHRITHESTDFEIAPMNFSKSSSIFGLQSDLFATSNGHLYAYLQDEWQIRAPFLVALGGRLILPYNSGNVSVEFMPSLGAVISPISQFRIKLAYQTAFRAPTFYENSDRLFDGMLNSQALTPVHLDKEKAHSLEASVWYGDTFSQTQFKNGLSFHFSKINDAIMEDNNSKLSNRNEIYIVGLRSINEAIFTGGHSFSLGLFYSLAYHKTFDIDGYPICKAGFYDLFSDRPSCKTNSGVPRFIARAQLYFDLLWLGNLNLMASFIGMTQILDIIKNPTTLFDIVYSSKPLWRYLSWFISFNSAFGGLFHLDRELVNARTSTGEAMFTIGIKSEL